MAKNVKEALLKCCLIPQRIVFGIMGSLGLMTALTIRISLSITILAMVVEVSTSNTTQVAEGICPIQDTSTHKISSGTFEWSQKMQGIILGSFYWGYIISHIPGGFLAERYGGKHVLGLGLLLNGILTLLTPILVDMGKAIALIIIRVFEGIGQGVIYPALTVMLARWAPEHERGRLGTIIFSGAQIGTVVGNMVSGEILYYFKWPTVYYIFGSITILWWLFWILLCYDTPESNPIITQNEMAYLENHIEARKPITSAPSLPFKEMIQSGPLWSLICAHAAHDWMFFIMAIDLPKYMNDILRFNINSTGLVSSLPFLAMWFSAVLGGVFCDYIINKNFMDVTSARKTFTTFASIGPPIFMLFGSYAGCKRYIVVFHFTIAFTFMGLYHPGIKINTMDLSTNYAGIIMALANGIGAFSGIVSSFVVGVLTPNQNMFEWRKVFWSSFTISSVSNIIYILWGSGEKQW